MSPNVEEIITEILSAAPEREFILIVVGGENSEGAGKDKEDLLEPDNQDSITEEADAFMEAFYEAIFGGETRQVAGGGGSSGGGGSDFVQLDSGP